MRRGFRSWRGGASEHRAFEELLAASLDALYATALRLCRGQTADAEDLLQDAVLRALRDVRTCRAPQTRCFAGAADRNVTFPLWLGPQRHART